jgi:hypothetical protein
LQALDLGFGRGVRATPSQNALRHAWNSSHHTGLDRRTLFRAFSGVAGHSARHLLDPRGTDGPGDGIIMGADADEIGTLFIATSKPSEGLVA